MGAAWFGWRVSWLLFSHTVDRGALVAQRDRPFMTKNYKQNSLPMNLPPQLLTLGTWTVPPLEGGLAWLQELLERGGGVQ